MTSEETFQKLIEAHGFKDAASIPVEDAKRIFCQFYEYEQQGRGDLEKLYNDHMQYCCDNNYRASAGEIESRLKECVAINFPSRCGKTKALLNFVQRIGVKVAFIGPRAESLRLDRLRRRLEGQPGQFHNVEFFAADDTPVSFGALRGHKFVVVDEWWALKHEFREYLAREFRVIAALGTIRYGAEFPILGQPHGDAIEKEIENRVRNRLHQEIESYTGTRMPVMHPMPKSKV